MNDSQERTLKRTPLYGVYAKHGGKTIDFGGWELPVQFAGIQKEHEAVRERAGLFDVSHMGEFRVGGPQAEAFLQAVTTNDVAKLAAGQAQYSLMCYPDGGTVDDLLVYKLADADYMVVVNAANIGKDWAWLEQQRQERPEWRDGGVRLIDESAATALLALQGPQAERILARLTDAPVAELKPFRFVNGAEVTVGGGAGVKALISRTGYTGEDGFELYVRSEDAEAVWAALLAAGEPDGLAPVGLGARDTLRFEARLPLYGQELSADITPLEGGLGMFVALGKGEFIGREALARQKEAGAPRRLVGVEMIERGIPRAHYPVYDGPGEDARRIGEVTTGTQSPTLKRNVGLALVAREYAALGTELYVDVRGKKLKAVVVKTPFVKRTKSAGEGK